MYNGCTGSIQPMTGGGCADGEDLLSNLQPFSAAFPIDFNISTKMFFLSNG